MKTLVADAICGPLLMTVGFLYGAGPETGISVTSVAKALAIYRIEKPRNPENRRKIGKK